MKIAIVMSLMSTIATLAPGCGQVVPLAAPEERVAAVAALEWFVSQDPTPVFAGKNLLISTLTSGIALQLGNGDNYTVVREGRRDLQLRTVDLRGLTASASTLQRCEKLSHSTMSPCAIEGEWVWLVVDRPGIRGDRAVVQLQVLEPEYRGEGYKPVVSVEMWEIFLQRERGLWRVKRASITGTS